MFFCLERVSNLKLELCMHVRSYSIQINVTMKKEHKNLMFLFSISLDFLFLLAVYFGYFYFYFFRKGRLTMLRYMEYIKYKISQRKLIDT